MKHKLNYGVARKLRVNLTDSEKIIWYYLRNNNLGHKFRRQQPIGKYVVDFVCLDRRLIIEIDGGQHDEQKRTDEARDLWLKKQRYTVLRFWNNEVMENREAVIENIASHIK